jgi:hypothetical protein
MSSSRRKLAKLLIVFQGSRNDIPDGVSILVMSTLVRER